MERHYFVFGRRMNNKGMAKRSKNSITIKEVAAQAGVSSATASRGLSGRGYVSLQARQRVQRAAAELAYRPHAAARSLKLNRTNTLGLMIADIVNPFYSYLADGLLDCARSLSYHVILCATDEDPHMEEEYLEVLMENRVDGIVAVPTGHNLRLWQEALKLGVKVVLTDREIAGIDADVVLVDNQKGAYEAVNLLLRLGHQRIGIICGPTSTTTGNGRLQGYYASLREAGVPIDPNLVQIGDFKRESGFVGAQRLLSLDDPPTAIFATNNVLGEVTMFAIRERGLKIPDDISLVLFDDVPWASLTSPKITVVAQPAYSLGYVSMERLVQRLQETDEVVRPPVRTILQPELVIRESCVPPARPSYVSGTA